MTLRPSALFVFCLLFVACRDTARPPAAPPATASIDESEYDVSPVKGSAALLAVMPNGRGGIKESGYLLNGLKQGTWTTYGEEQVYPTKIISYIDGALNGPFIEMDQQGRIALVANYKANVLHGPYSKYQIGRPVQTVNYVDGLMDGPLKEYDFRSGKIQKEVTYAMGKLHGPFRYYNDDGGVTMEYTYAEGERVQ